MGNITFGSFIAEKRKAHKFNLRDMLKRLFAVLAKCESPFCEELVTKMKAFGFSLLPVALFATIGETLSTAFLSAGRDTGISIQWGVLIAFAVTMCLVTVFKYGVQLQKESDETL